MKKFITSISLIGLGIVLTIGVQSYFIDGKQNTTTVGDSTKVDSTIIPVVVDTTKTDSIK